MSAVLRRRMGNNLMRKSKVKRTRQSESEMITLEIQEHWWVWCVRRLCVSLRVCCSIWAWAGRESIVTPLAFSTPSFSTSSTTAYHHLAVPSDAIQTHNCDQMANKPKEANMLKCIFIGLAFFYYKHHHLGFIGHISRSRTSFQRQLFQFSCSSRIPLFLNIC